MIDKYNVRKLNSNNSEVLHRPRERNPSEGIYQEAQCQIIDKKFIMQDELVKLAWNADVWEPVSEILNKYTKPSAHDFDESQIQGPHTVIVPSYYRLDSSKSQNL